jgi:hypothetical protein
MHPICTFSLNGAAFGAKVGKVGCKDRGGDLDRTVEGQGGILSRLLRDIPLGPGFPVAFPLHNTDYAILGSLLPRPSPCEKSPALPDRAFAFAFAVWKSADEF